MRTVLFFNPPPPPQEVLRSIVEQPGKILKAMSGEATLEVGKGRGCAVRALGLPIDQGSLLWLAEGALPPPSPGRHSLLLLITGIHWLGGLILGAQTKVGYFVPV